MNKLLYILFLFLSIFAFPQKIISGKVTDADGQAVSSASVTVEEVGKDAIIAYGISNSKGEYKVSFSTNDSEIEVKVKAFNHKPLLKRVKNENQNLNFKLESEATEIKEVKLKTKLITKKGDTISYDLQAFESKSDRTLSDVLKKIPGIEVNKDGSILYQGEAINKFYVNGKDLMEGGYGTINNSLPKDAVQKVEVMENHQPVKILQDKVVSEQAAINIKLKNKVTMTGRAEVGTGFMDPWLWNLKLTPMFFGQKNQWVINYKTNNTGETVENEGNMLAFGNRWEGRRNQASQDRWLDVETASTPSLPEKRYLMNNVHFLSANLLTNPFKNKEWELKANANYTNNAVTRESYSETNNYQLGAKYFTNILNHFYTNKAKGEVIFTKNAKKGFFKNTTTFTQFWNADRANVNRKDINGERLAAETTESPTVSFQNSLSTIIPWKEKMINLTSYLSYQNDYQTLGITPASYLKFPQKIGNNYTFFDFGADTQMIEQNFRMKSLEANHSANIAFTKKNWTLTPEVGLNFSTNKMTSDILKVKNLQNSSLGKDFMNDLKFTETVPFASLGINFKNENWMVFMNLPFNFNHISAEDPLRNVSKNVNKTTFEPNFFAQYSFASFWKANINGAIRQSFGEIGSVYAGRIILSPSGWNAMNAQNPLPENLTKTAGTRLEYRNPLNNLFFNVGYRYNTTKRNLISSSILNASGFSDVTYEILDNTNQNNSYNAEIGKYFPKFKTNASLNFSNSFAKSQIFQNAELIDTKSDSKNLGFKFNNTYFEWLSVDFNFAYSWSEQKNAINNSKYSGYMHNLSAYIYPKENHTFGFYWDQINSGSGDRNYGNAFYDLSYQYTWAKKKVDFELKWLNIANHKVFERFSVNTIGDSYTKIQLRPSQVMFTVKFNFK